MRVTDTRATLGLALWASKSTKREVSRVQTLVKHL